MIRRCSICKNNGHNARTCTLRGDGEIVKKSAKKAKVMMPSTSNLKQEMRNWLDLPSDVTANILSRIGMVDILINTQFVCTAWFKICKDPSMWRVFSMNDFLCSPVRLATVLNMSKHALDRSQGKLADFTYTDKYSATEFLQYAANRSSQLRRLELAYHFTGIWAKAVMKFPLLEELNLYVMKISKEDIETVGRYCPMLKTLKVNEKVPNLQEMEPDENSIMSYNEIAIAIGQNLAQLRHLELIGNEMTNIGLQAILDNCHHLETLDLRACSNIVLKGDLEKKCVEQIKCLKLPNDSLEGYPYLAKPDIEEYEDYYDYGCDCCAFFNTPRVEKRNFADNFDPYDIDAYNDAIYDQMSRQGRIPSH